MIFIFVFENYQNSFSWDPFFGLFWSAKYLSFGSGSCEIRILSGLIQETYTLGKVKIQVLLLTIKFVWSHCPFYFIFVCFSFCADFVFCFWILFFWIFRYLLSLDIYRPWILCSRSLDVFLSTAEKFHCIAFQIQVLIGTQTISCSEISQENVQFTLQSNCPEKFHKLTRKHRW